jgi:hypothetical protein
MKYIVSKDDEDNEIIFVFPKFIDHDRFHEGVQSIRFGSPLKWKRQYLSVISAGFVSASGCCYGHSETLNVSSRPILDSKLLAESLGRVSDGKVPNLFQTLVEQKEETPMFH